jgi:hypothetical protein
VFLNWLKDILSCRAQWVVLTVKISALNVIPLERYRSHNFSWKFQKSLKTKKFAKFANFVDCHFSLLYGKKIPNTYSCSSWSRAIAYIPFLILYILKHLYSITLAIWLIHLNDQWIRCSAACKYNFVKTILFHVSFVSDNQAHISTYCDAGVRNVCGSYDNTIQSVITIRLL